MEIGGTSSTFGRELDSFSKNLKLFFGANASTRYFSGAFNAPLYQSGGGVFRFAVQERGNICI